jgi:uncharacterized protein
LHTQTELISVFGRYDRGFSYTDPEINLRIDDSSAIPEYRRECGGGVVKKHLAADYDAIHIHPVEPVNLPQEITHHLEISFPPIVIPPAAKKKFYVTFPVEIGVFFEIRGEMNLLDVFSLVPTKFSLYGLPGTGIITRWYRSSIFSDIPVTDLHREGVMELTLANNSSATAEVSRAVFDSYGMQLFYGDRVGMTAAMEIISPLIATTTFAALPPHGCPHRSIDLYAVRRFAIGPRKSFFMESGMA